MKNDLQGAKNMKLLLCVFEQLSGLKINFYKSESLTIEPQKILNGNTPISLDVVWVLPPSGTLES
jgi:hypothetical protein